MGKVQDLLTKLLPNLMDRVTHYSHTKVSKHMLIGKNYRSTKAYADDRQKAPWNRRKHGRRKQR